MKADDSDMGCVATATHSGKRQARLATYHIERLLKEAYPNHSYPIKHKLKDYGMMKNFMTSGSITWDRGLEEDPSGSDVMPFPGEDVVMTVYNGCLPLGRYHMSKLGPRTSTRCGTQGCKGASFQYVCIYIHMNMYIIVIPKEKNKKMMSMIAQGHGDGSRPELSPRDWCQRYTPLTGSPK
jgi:hypothetical protein